MKKIEVSEAALDTLQRMVEELQSERDALLSEVKNLVNWYGLRDGKNGVALKSHDCQKKEIASAMRLIAKCNG